VKIPSINCLLGDKLAAFAPTTIGVLYKPFHKKTGEPVEPRPIRVMKQLFDVGELFAVADNLPLVAETYRRIFVGQNKYRGGKFTVEQALDDTLDAAYWLTQINTSPVKEIVQGAQDQHRSVLQLASGRTLHAWMTTTMIMAMTMMMTTSMMLLMVLVVVLLLALSLLPAGLLGRRGPGNRPPGLTAG
jgi:hypothetical protein